MTSTPAPASIPARALEHLYDSVPTTLALLSDQPLSTQQLTGLIIALDALPDAIDALDPMQVTLVTQRLSGRGTVPRIFSTADVAWLRPATPAEIAFCAPEIDTAVLAPETEAVSPSP